MTSPPPSAFSHLPAVVVTGAAGFIGRRVVARLAERGANVLAVDRAPSPADWPPGVEYRRADLGTDPGAVPAAAVLVHLAWNTDRADAAGQAKSVADFTRLLAPGGWSRVVGLGSAEEYGELGGRLSEDRAPGRMLSAYGRAKHEACRALQAWAGSSGRPAIWLRPFVVYGPGQGGNMAIPYALRCVRDRTPAEFTDGFQLRDFVHVDDVAAGIAAAVRATRAGGACEVCNLGRGEPVRLREVLDRIAEQTDSRGLFRFGSQRMRPNEPCVQYADVAAAERLLGWRARIPWREGVAALCKTVR